MRLDQYLVENGYFNSKSKAQQAIIDGKISVNNKIVTKKSFSIDAEDVINIVGELLPFVSRGGSKLEKAINDFKINLAGKTIVDIGSSTGGFTDCALQNDALKVIAVDVGTDQLHSSLQGDMRIELHEKTDIRDFIPHTTPDIVVMDVSFISLREILPHIATFAGVDTQIVAMVKPQFEAGKNQVNKGVIKNDAIRRQILKDFEVWTKGQFVIRDKRDSEVTGAKGNRERFYSLNVTR